MVKPFSDSDQKVLDQLRLDPDQFQRYRDKALLSWICNNRVETPARDKGVKRALKQFRVDNQLDSRAQLLDYMARADLNEAQLTAIMQSIARIDYIRQTAGDLRSGVIDQLKLDGRYFDLLDIAKRKQRAIQSAGADPDHADIVPAQLLAWYFGQQLGSSIPQRLEDHLATIDLENSDDFYRLIAADYLYWRAKD
jgi:hypothetical protein